MWLPQRMQRRAEQLLEFVYVSDEKVPRGRIAGFEHQRQIEARQQQVQRSLDQNAFIEHEARIPVSGQPDRVVAAELRYLVHKRRD